MVAVIDKQLAVLQARFPGTTAQPLADEVFCVVVPEVPLSAAWSKPSTTVYFLAPAGYPMARPDCFWIEEQVRLANGQNPQSSAVPNQIPGTGISGLWFSWHLECEWDPNRDTLCTWMNSILERLGRNH